MSAPQMTAPEAGQPEDSAPEGSALEDTALSLRDLSVSRGGREVVHPTALDLRRGETIALMGPNGSGKSTLLLAAALLLPARGEITLMGERPGGAGDRVRLRRLCATVFQDAALLDMSVRANVETALRLHGIPRAERRERVDHWLDRLGVLHLAEARPHTLSGGEAQRASLARAFAVEPAVLFLDEPFAALDLETTTRLVGEVRELLAVTGCSALLATHDQGEAQLLADRLGIVLDGEIMQLGPATEVLRAPASPQVARFLGHGVLPAALLGDAGHAYASLPPEAARLLPTAAAEAAETETAAAPRDGDDSGGRVTLLGTALAVGVARGQALVTVDVGGTDRAAGGQTVPLPVRIDAAAARALRPGASLTVEADLSRVTWHTSVGATPPATG